MAWTAPVGAVGGVALCERRGCRLVLGDVVPPGPPGHRFAYGVRAGGCAAGSRRAAFCSFDRTASSSRATNASTGITRAGAPTASRAIQYHSAAGQYDMRLVA